MVCSSARVRAAVLLACILVAGCSSTPSRETAKAAAAPAVRRSEIPFVFTVEQQLDKIVCSVTAERKLDRFDRVMVDYANLGEGVIEITDAHGQLLFADRHSLAIFSEPMKEAGKVWTTTHQAYVWAVPESLVVPFTSTVRLTVAHRDGTLIFDSTLSFTFNPELRPPLKLRLGMEQLGAGNFQMRLTVKRRRTVKDEYLPSSLTHDWVILNAEGKPIWQQSLGSMYMQVITPVMPQSPGEETDYTDSWDGLGNLVPGVMPTGEYKLVGVIPCKPLPVRDTINFILR